MRAYSGVSLHVSKALHDAVPEFTHPAFDMEVADRAGDARQPRHRVGLRAERRQGLCGQDRLPDRGSPRGRAALHDRGTRRDPVRRPQRRACRYRRASARAQARRHRAAARGARAVRPAARRRTSSTSAARVQPDNDATVHVVAAVAQHAPAQHRLAHRLHPRVAIDRRSRHRLRRARRRRHERPRAGDDDDDALPTPGGDEASVLDQSTAAEGVAQTVAIRETLELARHCEALGYHRYWVSEHHNSDSIVGTAPEVLMAAIAATTSRIRVGSAGVMLPHYSALKVAEQFRVLEGDRARPHRPRRRPRARLGPAHRLRAQSARERRRRVSAAGARAARVGVRRAARRRPSVRGDQGASDRVRRARSCGSSAAPTTARSSPRISACRMRSRISSAKAAASRKR